MAELSAVNLSSLGIVAGELEETLGLAGEAWHDYLANPQDTGLLRKAQQHFAQAQGALRLIQLHGLEMLCAELQSQMEQLLEKGQVPGEMAASAISDAIQCMPRYLEYVRATGKGKPVLLTAAISNIRVLSRKPRLAEHHFSNFEIAGSIQLPELDDEFALDLNKLGLTGRRLRQMFQTGLIGIIRDEASERHLGLMQRACERMYGLLRTRQAGESWLLVAACMNCLNGNGLGLTSSRRRWLMSVDQLFKVFLQDVVSRIDQPVEETARMEMLYMLSLLPANNNPLAELALKHCTINNPDREKVLSAELDYVYSIDRQLEEARLERISSLLAAAQEYLDGASRANEYTEAQLQKLGEQIEQICEQLGHSAGETLRDLLLARRQDVLRWCEQPESVSWDSLMPLADALIMLEGFIQNARQAVGDKPDVVEQADATTLESAELAVVNEAQAGLNLAKRAITSFVESAYDRAHLGNIVTTLNSVRGGLELLDLPRAADILERSSRFMESAMDTAAVQDNGILDTLADALISLEYYLAQLELRKDADESVLEVADQSLTEIGFPAAA